MLNPQQSNADLDALAIRQDERQGEGLANEVHAFLHRFIAHPGEHERVAHTLWILHTHLMDSWSATPRLAFLSAEPASGKSRALEITELLVPTPVLAVNVSPSYLFRRVGSATESARATILYDEIDTVFGPKAKENEEIRGLLNAGHKRTGIAGRCVVKGKEIVTEDIPAYSAVAVAGLGWLPDTILTRSVIIRMRRRHAGETVEQFRGRLHAPVGAQLKAKIETWAPGASLSIAAAQADIHWPEMPEGIEDRDADVWEPLIAVADTVGGRWPVLARKAAVAIVQASKDTEQSLGVRLLGDIRKVFDDHDELPTVVLLKELHDLEESPWGDMKGKPLDDRGLANRLKAYSIKSCRKYFGNKQARGYERSAFLDSWQRYLPLSPGNSVTNVTTVSDDAHDSNKTHVTPMTHVAAMGSRECAYCHKGNECEPLSTVSVAGEEVALHGSCVDAWRAKNYGDDQLDIPPALRRT